MSSHRAREETVADILSIIAEEGGVRKTRLLYGANLSFQQREKYTKMLEEWGLILWDGETRKFIITGEGRQYLAAYGIFLRAKKKLLKQTSKLEEKQAHLRKMLRVRRPPKEKVI